MDHAASEGHSIVVIQPWDILKYNFMVLMKYTVISFTMIKSIDLYTLCYAEHYIIITNNMQLQWVTQQMSCWSVFVFSLVTNKLQFKIPCACPSMF